jgi:ferric-dicitrate binding protein FerR (iron transport regulator)
MRSFLAVLAFLGAVSTIALSAAEADAGAATFSAISGKVEYRLSGSDWQPARIGLVLEKGALVSTGFKSSATLQVGASSIYLKALTRLSLEDLVKTSGGTRTKLYLLAGRVRADVPPQAGKTTDFSVDSPTATASVRGTAFEFDGLNLLVSRGTVRFLTPTSQYHLVGAAEFSYLAPNGTITAPTSVGPQSDLGNAARLIEREAIESFSPPPSPTLQTAALSVTVQ